jgi:hypothetical protein
MVRRHASAVLLSSSAALVLFATLVEASSCLPSASAVRQEHPGSWPSWTLRAPGHEGTKCWYPATNAAGHDHQIETTQQTSPASAVRINPPTMRDRALSAPAAARNGIGRSRETLSPQDVAILSPEGSLFTERFEALFDESFFGSPADDQWAIERLNDTAARLRSAIQDSRPRGSPFSAKIGRQRP